MSNPLPNDGATVAPLAEKEAEASLQECPGSGDGRRMAHKFAWMKEPAWKQVECMRCGKVETR